MLLDPVLVFLLIGRHEDKEQRIQDRRFSSKTGTSRSQWWSVKVTLWYLREIGVL